MTLDPDRLREAIADLDEWVGAAREERRAPDTSSMTVLAAAREHLKSLEAATPKPKDSDLLEAVKLAAGFVRCNYTREKFMQTQLDHIFKAAGVAPVSDRDDAKPKVPTLEEVEEHRCECCEGKYCVLCERAAELVEALREFVKDGPFHPMQPCPCRACMLYDKVRYR